MMVACVLQPAQKTTFFVQLESVCRRFKIPGGCKDVVEMKRTKLEASLCCKWQRSQNFTKQ